MGGIEERIRVSQDRTLVLQRIGPILVLRGDTEYVAWTVPLGQGDGIVFAKLNIKNIGAAVLPLASCMLRVGTRSDESGDIQQIPIGMSRLASLIVGVNIWNANVASRAEIVVTSPRLDDKTIEIRNLVIVWLPVPDLINI